MSLIEDSSRCVGGSAGGDGLLHLGLFLVLRPDAITSIPALLRSDDSPAAVAASSWIYFVDR